MYPLLLEAIGGKLATTEAFLGYVVCILRGSRSLRRQHDAGSVARSPALAGGINKAMAHASKFSVVSCRILCLGLGLLPASGLISNMEILRAGALSSGQTPNSERMPRIDQFAGFGSTTKDIKRAEAVHLPRPSCDVLQTTKRNQNE